jgi:hypothetical protein
VHQHPLVMVDGVVVDGVVDYHHGQTWVVVVVVVEAGEPMERKAAALVVAVAVDVDAVDTDVDVADAVDVNAAAEVVMAVVQESSYCSR